MPIGGRRATDPKPSNPARGTFTPASGGAPGGVRTPSKFTPVPPASSLSGGSAAGLRPQSRPGQAGQMSQPARSANQPTSNSINPFGNLTVNAPAKSGINKAPGATATSATSATSAGSGHWSCSKCAKALGPRSVNQGTAIFLEGNLICVECVKGNRRNQAQLPVATLAIFGVVTLAILGVVGFFLPSQALLIGLLLGVSLLLVGTIGFTLDGKSRLGTVAAGLLVIALTSYGLIVTGEHKEEKAAFSEIATQADEVKTLLAKDCLLEAEARINTVETQMDKKYGGQPPPNVTTAIVALRKSTQEWKEAHFGKLQTTEQKLLSELYHRVGSLTPYTQTPRIQQYKIEEGKHLLVTVATDVKPPEVQNSSDDGTTINKETDDPIGAEASRVAMLAIKQDRALETITVRIVSGGPNSSELLTRTYDATRVAEIRNNLNAPARARTRTAESSTAPRFERPPEHP